MECTEWTRRRPFQTEVRHLRGGGTKTHASIFAICSPSVILPGSATCFNCCRVCCRYADNHPLKLQLPNLKGSSDVKIAERITSSVLVQVASGEGVMTD